VKKIRIILILFKDFPPHLAHRAQRTRLMIPPPTHIHQ
jgi:hypothetical protein